MDEIIDVIYLSQCLTGGQAEDFELWIARYAEMLNCEPRAGAVAVAIESATSGSPANNDRILWLEGIARMLCCEPRPVSVFGAIEKQHQELASAKRMIADLRGKLSDAQSR